jgi:hypothetical protein
VRRRNHDSDREGRFSFRDAPGFPAVAHLAAARRSRSHRQWGLGSRSELLEDDSSGHSKGRVISC